MEYEVRGWEERRMGNSVSTTPYTLEQHPCCTEQSPWMLCRHTSTYLPRNTFAILDQQSTTSAALRKCIGFPQRKPLSWLYWYVWRANTALQESCASFYQGCLLSMFHSRHIKAIKTGENMLLQIYIICSTRKGKLDQSKWDLATASHKNWVLSWLKQAVIHEDYYLAVVAGLIESFVEFVLFKSHHH